MRKLTAAQELKKSILALEKQQIFEGNLLKEQLSVTYESIKPLTVLRKMINDIAQPSEIKETIFQTVTGLLTGYLTRKLIVRSSKSPLLRLVGIAVEYGVTNFVINHADTLQRLAMNLMERFAGTYEEKNE